MPNLIFKQRLAVTAGFVIVSMMGGCEAPAPEESTVLVVRDEATPALASSRDGQISLFGGLPRRGEAPFEGRTRGALLQHSFTREGGDFDGHVDREGKRIVYSSTMHSQHPDLYIKSLNGTAIVQLTSDPSSDIQPAFSPDNSRVAFASDRTGNWDLWVIGIDGQQPIQVTHSPMAEVHPSWSPDGRQLVFSALPEKSGQWELWIVPAEEHATPTMIGYGVFPEWSPVDDRILFQRARERGSRWFSIWTIELVYGEPRYPTEVASSADYAMILPSWSRDGKHIAFTTVQTLPSIDPEFGSLYEASDVWVMDDDGGSRVRLTDGRTVNYAPTWSPIGQVLFTSSRNGHENIWSLTPSTGITPSMPITEPTAEKEEPTRVIQTRSGGHDRS